MASVEDSSQPVSSSGSDVYPDASLSTGNENTLRKADAEARCTFTYTFRLTYSVICMNTERCMSLLWLSGVCA